MAFTQRDCESVLRARVVKERIAPADAAALAEVVSDVVDLELARLERVRGRVYDRANLPADVVDHFFFAATGAAGLAGQIGELVR